MNAAEFNIELSKLMNRAMTEGFGAGKMGLDNIVGMLDMQKLEIVRWAQDEARRQAQAQAGKIVAAKMQLPPDILGGRG